MFSNQIMKLGNHPYRQKFQVVFGVLDIFLVITLKESAIDRRGEQDNGFSRFWLSTQSV